MVGLALMAGGAAGNMADRLITGYVPDMIETLFVRFPIFNLADSCLTIGCVMLIISLLFRQKDWANL
jgi:signal peptidase II